MRSPSFGGLISKKLMQCLSSYTHQQMYQRSSNLVWRGNVPRITQDVLIRQKERGGGYRTHFSISLLHICSAVRAFLVWNTNTQKPAQIGLCPPSCVTLANYYSLMSSFFSSRPNQEVGSENPLARCLRTPGRLGLRTHFLFNREEKQWAGTSHDKLERGTV